MIVRRQKPLLGLGLIRGHPANRGLIGRWLANESGGRTLIDIAGRRNASLVGTSVWDRRTRFNARSVYGGGSGGYITTSGNSVLNGLSAFTAMGWIYGVLTNEHSFISLWDGTTNQILVRQLGAGGPWQFFTNTSSAVGGSLTATPNPGSWQHCAFTYDGATMRAYFDGVQDATTFAQSGALATNTASPLRLTGDNATRSSERNHNGYIDNVSLWNRALTSSEIKQLYREPFLGIERLRAKSAVKAPSGGSDTAINPGVGTVAITGHVPSIAQTANQSVVPDAGNIAISGHAPTVSRTEHQEVLPGAGVLTITGHVPTIHQGVNTAINPDAGTLAITGHVPTIAQSANQLILPDAGVISISGHAPTVAQSDNRAILPPQGTIVISGHAPIVEQAPASPNITPDTGFITITGHPPTVTQGLPINQEGDGGSPDQSKPRKVREVSLKPLLARILDARQGVDATQAEKTRPARKNARRKAKIIEVEAAKLAMGDGGEAQFRALMDQWLAQKPLLPDAALADAISAYEIFMAKVALQVDALLDADDDDVISAFLAIN